MSVNYMLMTRDACHASPTRVTAMKLQSGSDAVRPCHVPYFIGFQLYLVLTCLKMCAEFEVIHESVLFFRFMKKDGNYKVARYERKRKDTAETFGIHVSTISKLSKLNKTTTELLRSFIRHFVPLFCYYMRTSIYTYVEEALLKWLNIDIHFNKATPLNVNSV